MNILISNYDPSYSVQDATLRLCFIQFIRAFFVPVQSELSIVFLKSSEMKEINREWYGDKATDILTFPFYSSKEEIYRESADEFCLGEILLSPDVICSKKSAVLSVDVETIKLLIHGALHILCYDHRTLRARDRMFTIQNRIVHEVLSEVNCTGLIKPIR